MVYDTEADIEDFGLIDSPFGPIIGCVWDCRREELRARTALPLSFGIKETVYEYKNRRLPGVCHNGNPRVPARNDWRFSAAYVDRLWDLTFRYFEDLPDSTPFVQATAPICYWVHGYAGEYIEYEPRYARWFTDLGSKRAEWSRYRAKGVAMGSPDLSRGG